MPKDLVPIKVKIGLRPNGHADHPDWTILPMINSDLEVRGHCPSGWIYDKTSGHKQETVDSPYGQQWGCLLCERAFVDQALLALPDKVTELTEVEFEDFFNNKSRAHMQENNVDQPTLDALQSELALKEKLGQPTTTLEDKIVKAIDPTDDEPGIKKNNNRYWADYKTDKGFTIKK